MIAKIKLIHGNSKVCYIFKTEISWNLRVTADHRGSPLQPKVGMTVIIPRRNANGGESFRFYIGYIVADLRTSDIILVERRDFGNTYNDGTEMQKLAKQLEEWGWEKEKVK